MADLNAASRWGFDHTAAGAATSAESVAWAAGAGLVLVVGPAGLDALDADTGALRFSLPSASLGVAVGTGNGVAVSGGAVAVTYDGPTPGSPGTVALYALDAGGAGAALRATIPVGVVPDMAVFTPDGARLLVAIEGEPTDDYALDPPGGVAIIDVASATLTGTAGFGGFDTAALRAAGVRLTGPAGTTAATDLEPEYIAVASDGTRAFVSLQENNALGVLDLTATPPAFAAVLPFGLKDHSVPGQGLDASDRDGGVNVATRPVQGLYMPDAIATFERDGRRYVVTANEGDTRDRGTYQDSARAGTLTLDAAAFPDAAALQADAALGRLLVSTRDGDPDGDGAYEALVSFGARSLSIFEVTPGGLVRTYDSGDLIERTLAAEAPALLPDSRSDDKGPEPEQVTLGTVDGQLYAFLGLERSNANMAFRIDAPDRVTYAGTIATPGDAAPEVSAFGAIGGAPALFVANEGSGTTRAYALSPEETPVSGSYTLQILHASDFEAGLEAVDVAANFAAIVDRLEDATPNSITLSSGDNFLPGPFIAAGTDSAVRPALVQAYADLLGVPAASLSGLALAPARLDIAILNQVGVQASAVGNHEFDLGPATFAESFDFTSTVNATTGATTVTAIGAQFPYLSANLDFSGDSATRGLVTAALRDAASYATTAADLASPAAIAAEAADAQLAPWTVIEEGGQRIGVLGLTTQILASISSVGGVRVADPAGDGGVDNTTELAAILQPLVDQMTAQGINKVVLLSHLQQNRFELDLATKLSGVDVIIAGGSNAIYADAGDALRPGDVAAQTYPAIRTGADGRPVAVVNTDGEFSYVGRLNLTFDANGVLDPAAIDPALNGPVATTDANVQALWGTGDAFAAGTRGGAVRALTDAVGAVIAAKDGNVQGFTDAFLQGQRAAVRTQETNLGDLTADANLAIARQVDPDVAVSIKNGGGIRAEIGAFSTGAVAEPLPPQANPDAGKPTGGVSQLDIENALRFNNALSVVTVTAAELEQVFEHAVAGVVSGATPGSFGQVGGVAFSYDAARTAQVTAAGAVTAAGDRVRSLAILNEDGTEADVVVRDGAVQGDPNRPIKLVTLSFLADNGDGYPIRGFADARTDLLNNPALPAGASTFAQPGSEQDALGEFLAARHGTLATAYAQPETPAAGDLRVQNLGLRADAVFQVRQDGAALAGGDGSDLLVGTAGRDEFRGSVGRDTVRGGEGFDVLRFQGTGVTRGDGGLLRDEAGAVTGFGFADGRGLAGETFFSAVEQVSFEDGRLEFNADGTGATLSRLYRGLLGRDATALDLAGQAVPFETLPFGVGVVGEGLATSTEGAAALGGLTDATFVARLYRAVLGREADAGGADYWQDQLAAGASRGAVAAGFATSAEGQADALGLAAPGIVVGDLDALVVGQAYAALLGRGVDAGSLGYWKGELDAGLDEAVLLRTVAASAEFDARYGSLGDAAFGRELVRNALGREAGNEEVGDFAARLAAGASRADLAVALLTGDEGDAALARLAVTGIDLL